MGINCKNASATDACLLRYFPYLHFCFCMFLPECLCFFAGAY